MARSEDIRLRDQAGYLLRAHLIRRRYVPGPHDWDVAHCAFCLAPFVDATRPDVLREGFVTLDGRHWVCPACFEDFRQAFGFVVDGAA
jgi:hypothetical protein